MYLDEVVEDLSKNIDEPLIENEFRLQKSILTEKSIKEILKVSNQIESEKTCKNFR